MNGIGIVEWQNNITEYPLKGAGKLSGIFSDANLVTYDGFVPVLNSVTITTTELILSMQFDDGTQSFNFNLENISQGASVRLKTTKRSYGTLVFGRLIADVLAGVLGNVITSNCRFDPSVIRTIDSTNGLYSINKLSGDVVINLDDNFILESNYFNRLALTAVSDPNKLQLLTLAAHPYLYTSTKKLQSISDNSINDVNVLDKYYNIIYNHASHLIGIIAEDNMSTIYDMSVLPSTILLEMEGIITGAATDGDNNLWVMCGTALYNLGQYPYELSDAIETDLADTKGLVYVNGTFYISKLGPIDYDIKTSVTRFSDSIYSISVAGNTCTTENLGMLNDTSILNTEGTPTTSLHVPSLSGLYVLDSTLYGWSVFNNQFTIYSINLSNCDATHYFDAQYDLGTGTVTSLFIGGITITLSSVTPLKTINGIAAINNQINIIGSDTMVITQPTNNTLALNLPIADQYLNIKRSTIYE